MHREAQHNDTKHLSDHQTPLKEEETNNSSIHQILIANPCLWIIKQEEPHPFQMFTSPLPPSPVKAESWTHTPIMWPSPNTAKLTHQPDKTRLSNRTQNKHFGSTGCMIIRWATEKKRWGRKENKQEWNETSGIGQNRATPLFVGVYGNQKKKNSQ